MKNKRTANKRFGVSRGVCSQTILCEIERYYPAASAVSAARTDAASECRASLLALPSCKEETRRVTSPSRQPLCASYRQYSRQEKSYEIDKILHF